MNMIPRGFMFWDIADEGNEIEVNNKKENLWLAKGLNRILKIRP